MKLKLKIHTIECENKLLLIVVESVVELGLSFFSFKLEVTADAPCDMGVCAFRTGTSCCLLCELSCEPARGLGRLIGVMGEGSGEVIREKMGFAGGCGWGKLDHRTEFDPTQRSSIFFPSVLLRALWCNGVQLFRPATGFCCKICLAQMVPGFV